MKKLAFTLSMAFVLLISINTNANEIQPTTTNPTPEKTCNDTEVYAISGVNIQFGLWSYTGECVSGNGICSISVGGPSDIEPFFGFKASSGGFSLGAKPEGMAQIQKHFGGATIIVEEDYKLSDEACAKIGLEPGYVIKMGAYHMEEDGKGNFITNM